MTRGDRPVTAQALTRRMRDRYTDADVKPLDHTSHEFVPRDADNELVGHYCRCRHRGRWARHKTTGAGYNVFVCREKILKIRPQSKK